MSSNKFHLVFKFIFSSFFALSLLACGGGSGNNEPSQSNTPPPVAVPPAVSTPTNNGDLDTSTSADNSSETNAPNSSVVMAYRLIDTVDNCLSGGVEIKTGIDDNNNSTLEPSEVDNIDVVCNGSNGTDGLNGSDSLINVVNEPAGNICSNSGIHINVGLDINFDEQLNLDEITQSATVCFPAGDQIEQISYAAAKIKGNVSNILRASKTSNKQKLRRDELLASNATVLITPSPIAANVDRQSEDTEGLLTQPVEAVVDESGNYEVIVPAGADYSIVMTNSANGTGAKIDNISVESGETKTQDIPLSSQSATGGVTMQIAELLTGLLLDNAIVEVLEIAEQKTTLEDGVVEFTNLPAGDYHLTINRSDYVGKYIAFNVVSGLVTDLGTAELNNQKGSAVGQLFSDSIDDLSNIIVFARAADDSVYSTLTNASGTFTFNALPVGEGYRFIVVANILDSVKSEAVTVVKNETVIVDSIPVTPRKANTGSIAGYVKFAERENSLDHAGIIVSVEGTDQEAITSKDGSYIINGLTAGNYSLNFTEANHQSQNLAIDVTVGTSTIVDTIVIGSLNGNISGKVIDNNDVALANVNLVIFETGQTTLSDNNGDFIFSDQPIGSYTVLASTDGYSTEEIEISIVQGETTVLENIILTPFVFSGVVNTGEQRDDHSGVTVTLSGTGLTELTALDGSFAFNGVEPGNYQLQVAKAGFQSQALGIVISENSVELGYVINLEALVGVVTGQVSLDNRIDHSGIMVTLIGTDYSTFTDSTGKWSLKLPLRNYSQGLSYTKPYYSELINASTLTIIENGEFTVTSALLIQNNAQITFNVDAVNTCSGDLVVTALGLSGDALGFSGNLQVSSENTIEQALPLGEYQLSTTCSDSGWESNVVNVDLTNAQDSYQLDNVNLRQSFLVINDGAEYTNEQQIALAIGNTDAVEMKIVDGINDTGWLALQNDYNYTLSIGNGLKTVTVYFKDINGVELSSVSDTIQLDTFLNVAYFNQSGANTRGDILHLSLSLAQELGATVTATIPGVVEALPLLDNGFGGDQTANDGIYERDFYIDTPIDINAPVNATITDLAGNIASTVSDTNLVLNTAPTIKNLINSSNIVAGEMTITFTTDEPATATILYGDSLANLANTIVLSSNLTKSHTVQLDGLSANSLTYYQLSVADSANNKTELTGQGKLAPAPVEDLAAYPGSNEVGLIWSSNEQAAGYRIYRSNDGGNIFTLVNADALIIERFYIDTLATNATQFQYYITAVDADNNESENSDTVSVTPLVTLAGPTEIAGGLIDTNTVWLKSRSPYNISANIKVKKDIELLLLAGTEVAFANANVGITLAGSMLALGQENMTVKISAFGADDTNSNNYSNAIIYEQGNNTPSVFNHTEFNYIKAYYDYENSYDRQNYIVPLQLNDGSLNIFSNGGNSDFYIQSANNTDITLSGWGNGGNSNSAKINSANNITATSADFDAIGGMPSTNYLNGLFIRNISNSIFNRISLYMDNGAIDDSEFFDSEINSVNTINNSTLTNSKVLGYSSLNATNNTLVNTQINLSGDNTKLVLHYSVIDTLSTVAAKRLDVSHNYWDTTDLTEITNKTGYSPDQSKNTHLYPIITSSDLYLADWDGDTIPDYLDYDNDNDGYSDLQEDWESDPLYGSIYNPLDADSHPTTAKDNDMDGLSDADDLDDDNDGLIDTEESIRLTDKFLADSDGDGVNDGNEVNYAYNPLDKANFPLMGNIIGKTIDNSNVNSQGAVYLAGEEQTNDMMSYTSVTPVNLTNVTVAPGTSLMIEKDTTVYFNDSYIIGDAANVITIRSTGAGNGSLYLNNTTLSYANIKGAISTSFNRGSVIDHIDINVNQLNNSGVMSYSVIQNNNGPFYNNHLISRSYVSGNYFYNQNDGSVINSYISLIDQWRDVYNSGELSSVYVGSRVYQQTNGTISNAVISSLHSEQANTVINSDIKLTSTTVNALFDNTFIQGQNGNDAYTGYGEPADQIGDGVAETIFTLNESDYTVDGIRNPRATANYPDVIFKPYLATANIWSPEDVGAWWDMNSPNTFADKDPSTTMGTLSGQIKLVGFTNHSGVTVSVIDTSLSTTTDAEGNWSIRLPARDYTAGIRFTKAHMQTITKDRSYSVSALQDTSLGLLNMAQLTASVSGVVVIDEASDYTQATITANKNGQTTIINPSAAGDFIFKDLPLGDYRFAVTYPNGSWETVTRLLTLDMGTTEHNLPLTRVRNSFVYINEGALYTNSAEVDLAITNANATNMVITEDNIASVSQSFNTSQTITLSGGDGEKTVKIDFTDENGNALTQAISTITLDTTVSLTSLTLSNVNSLGDTLHMALTANEAGGMATVSIPGLFTDLPLYDDGTNGDMVADDGIYETDYLINSAEDINAVATATFVDRAVNTDTITSMTTMDIATSPTISDLLVQSNEGKLIISFATNEPVMATVNYGSSADNLDQSLDVSSTEALNHSIELSATAGQNLYFSIITDDGVTTVTTISSSGLLANPSLAGLSSSAGDEEIGLVWTTQAEASGYRIYRSIDSNTFGLIDTISAETPYYVDDSVYNDQAYHYRVTWLDENGVESDQSRSVTAMASMNNAGGTEINGGVIANNQIWLASRSPYIITANMLVKASATLSLMPGAEIEFNGAKRHIMVQGNIMAYGTSDAVVKISTDPLYNTSTGENGGQSAIIYDIGNNTASEFIHTELNYIEVYKNYTNVGDRRYNPVPVTFDHSVINSFYGNNSSFAISTLKNSNYNEYSYGVYYYSTARIRNTNNTVFNALDLYTKEPREINQYIARVDQAVNTTFNNGYFDFQNGSIDSSVFNQAKAYRAAEIKNSRFTDSSITGSNSLRLTDSQLVNSTVSLTGDNTRLTMHYSQLDTDSTVSAKLLDIAYNYWGSTDLDTIALQSGYSPNIEKNTHLYPIISGYDLYNADWDEDGVPDYLDYDNDNDGYSDLQEDWESDPTYGGIFNPLDNSSFPVGATDNDMDGLSDNVDQDDDNDGLSDTDEDSYSTDPFLADSDGDGVNDGDEVRYGYDSLDKTNFPMMGNITGKTIDNSNINDDGVVYIVGYEVSGITQAVQLRNVTVSAGTSLMLEKDTNVNFYNSVLAGNANSVVIVRSTGAGNGAFNLHSSKASFINVKLTQSYSFDNETVIERSDMSLGQGSNYGTIQNSYITLNGYLGNKSTGKLIHNYLTGSSYVNNNGNLVGSYVDTNGALYNDDNVSNSVIVNQIYMKTGSSLVGSIANQISSGGISRVIKSDVGLRSRSLTLFFDNSYLEMLDDGSTYDGFGSPVDQLGDGVAETIFTMGSVDYTVDGINNPRGTKNFPNGAADLWEPSGVGALWNKDAADLTAFPEPL